MPYIKVTASGTTALARLIRGALTSNGWTSPPTGQLHSSFSTADFGAPLINTRSNQSLFISAQTVSGQTAIIFQVTGLWLPAWTATTRTDVMPETYLNIDNDNPVEVHIFVNDLRVIVSVNNKSSFFTTAYCGKLFSFANNTTFPNPYYTAGSHWTITPYDNDTLNNSGSIVHPGVNTAYVRTQGSTTARSAVINKGQVANGTGAPLNYPTITSTTGNIVLPCRTISEKTIPNYTDALNKISYAQRMGRYQRYANGEVDLFPALVYSVSSHKLIGWIHGVYVIPPEMGLAGKQVTIGNANYRVVSYGRRVTGIEALYAIEES